MKIAIIDDGIDIDMINGGLNIKTFLGDNSKKNYIRHGTKVVQTIEKYYSGEKEYCIFNIMDNHKNNGVNSIIVALNQLLVHTVDLVVMCLVIRNSLYYQEISELCDKLVLKGTILLAAVSNKGEYSFPAEKNGIIGVGRMASPKHNFVWNENCNVQILGDVTPEFICLGKNERILFSGTSKATAKIAAWILEKLESGKKNVYQILQLMEKEFVHQFQNYIEEIECREYQVILKHKQKYYIICEVLQRMGYSLSVGSDYYFENMVNSIDEFGRLILDIIGNFNIQIEIQQLNYFDFISAYALSNYLGEYNEKTSMYEN